MIIPVFHQYKICYRFISIQLQPLWLIPLNCQICGSKNESELGTINNPQEERLVVFVRFPKPRWCSGESKLHFKQNHCEVAVLYKCIHECSVRLVLTSINQSIYNRCVVTEVAELQLNEIGKQWLPKIQLRLPSICLTWILTIRPEEHIKNDPVIYIYIMTTLAHMERKAMDDAMLLLLWDVSLDRFGEDS